MAIPMDEETIHEIDRDAIRVRLLKYSRKAWDMLPSIKEPKILDIGCGSGLPTIHLAVWSHGTVVGLDIDQLALDKLAARARTEGLENRVEVMCCSLFDIDLPDASFDIIWAEGSLNVIGFQRALREWRRLLRPGGFLVVHDDANDLDMKLSSIEANGYELFDHFHLPDDAWWVDYYAPLKERVGERQKAWANDPQALASLENVQAEIDRYLTNPEESRSMFLILKKT
jgi:SAM-dependent methyltransferase